MIHPSVAARVERHEWEHGRATTPAKARTASRKQWLREKAAELRVEWKKLCEHQRKLYAVKCRIVSRLLKVSGMIKAVEDRQRRMEEMFLCEDEGRLKEIEKVTEEATVHNARKETEIAA